MFQEAFRSKTTWHDETPRHGGREAYEVTYRVGMDRTQTIKVSVTRDQDPAKTKKRAIEAAKKKARVGRSRFSVVKVTGPGLSESTLYDKVRLIAESKLSSVGVRVLQRLADEPRKYHDEIGVSLIEIPLKRSAPNRRGFGPQKRDLAPILTVQGAGPRQIKSLERKGLIKATPEGRHQITDKGRAALAKAKGA